MLLLLPLPKKEVLYSGQSVSHSVSQSVCLSVCSLDLLKSSEQILMKSFGGVWAWPADQVTIDFGGDPDHDPDPVFFTGYNIPNCIKSV